MSGETTVRLRDQRKPGWGWYDKEIYDVFGDELRQDGISVYMTLTRLSWDGVVRKERGGAYSIRELAEHARMKKDTFHRSLKRVILLGLVAELKGSTAQSASLYELVDVKELATRYLRRAMAIPKAESVSARDTRPAPTLAQLVNARIKEHRRPENAALDNCLPERQMDDGSEFVPKKICSDEAETEVSQNCTTFATEVSQDERHLRQDSRLQESRTPPLPLPVGGELREDEREELAEVNAMRARMTPRLGPLAWAEYAPHRNPPIVQGTERPGGRVRRFVPHGRGREAPSARAPN